MKTLSFNLVRRADADDLVQANLESRSYHEPWVRPFTTLRGFEEWFNGHSPEISASFVIRDLASGRIVGVTSLSQIFLKSFQSAYLSYYGMLALAGRGLMTEAVRLTTSYAFDKIGLHRLEANIQPGNRRSIAVVMRAGFRQEGFSPRYLKVNGVWCDHERWALLADDISEVPARPAPYLD